MNLKTIALLYIVRELEPITVLIAQVATKGTIPTDLKGMKIKTKEGMEGFYEKYENFRKGPRHYLKMLKEDSKPIKPASPFVSTGQPAQNYSFISALRELVESNLIECFDSEGNIVQLDFGFDFILTRYNYNIIKTTYRLSSIQSMFGISLNRLLEAHEFSTIAKPIWGSPIESKSQWAEVFVAMPFEASLQPIYHDCILTVVNSLSLTCKRGDDFFSTNTIMNEVWSSIYHAKICIIECTGRNPNVFYELGIAHTLGCKSILITQDLDDVPFDIQHMRIIPYDNTLKGRDSLKDRLNKTLVTELDIKKY